MENFSSNLRYKIKKYVKLNNFSYEYVESRGATGVGEAIKKGSTRLNNLFVLSQVLDVDVRNFLIFDDNTYKFKKSFDNFEDFYRFLRHRFKIVRQQKKMTAKDILYSLNRSKNLASTNTIYDFESGRSGISIKKFYQYLSAIDVTSNDFFLENERYEVKENTVNNEMTIDMFNDRIYEIEKAQGKMLRSDINISIDRLPTLHVFLRICKCLKIHPRDFFDFEKKEFEIYRLKNIDVWFNYLKNKMNIKYLKNNRYIELSTVFLFCNENNIPIVDFFDISRHEGNISQIQLIHR